MRTAARSCILLLALLLLSFALPRVLPGDPVAALASGNGQDAAAPLSDQARAHLRAYYGLDRPLPQQLAHFLVETARGDLGYSISLNRPVAELIADRLPWTAGLIGPSLLLAAMLGCGLGIAGAWWSRRRGQRAIAVGLLLAGALPDFVVGIVLVLLLGVWLPLLPTSGATEPFGGCAGAAGVGGCAADLLGHTLLPVLTLTASQLPAFFLLTRAAMLGELGQPYVLAARARGLSEAAVALRHAGRNAILPVVTLLGLRLGALLGGVVVVETLFAYPGLGRLAFQAALARDYPLLQALVLLGGLAILTLNSGADLLRQRIDPRLRQEAVL